MANRLNGVIGIALLVVLAAGNAAAQNAYITNGDGVSVISRASNTVTTTIPVGVNPEGVAAAPDGSAVYVANLTNNTVSVISTATNTVTAAILVGNMPAGIAITPNGGYAYVTNGGGGTVSVISLANNTVIATIPVQNTPYGVAITPNSATVYVANYLSGTLSVISTASNTVTATLNVGGYPYGLAITPDGFSVWITDNELSVVSVLSTATNSIVSTISGGELSGSLGVAITPDGNTVYVTNDNATTVPVISASTARLRGDTGLAANAEMGNIFGLAADPNNNVYLSDNLATDAATAARIRVVSNGIINTFAGNGMIGASGDGGLATSAELNFPAGLRADSLGNLYITDVYNNNIREVSNGIITTVAGNSNFMGFAGDGGQAASAQLNNPNGVAVDSHGNIFIADVDNNRVRMVTASTGIITTIAGNGNPGYSGDGGPATNAELTGPWDVVVNSAACSSWAL